MASSLVRALGVLCQDIVNSNLITSQTMSLKASCRRTRRFEGDRLLRLGPAFRYTWVTSLAGLAYP